MQTTATSVMEYFESLPDECQTATKEFGRVISINLPGGFREVMFEMAIKTYENNLKR